VPPSLRMTERRFRRALGLPGLRLVQSRSGRNADKERWREKTEEDGAPGDAVLRRRRRSSARCSTGRRSCSRRLGAASARRPTTRCSSLRLPRRPLDAVGDAVALPRGDRRRAERARRRWRRSATATARARRSTSGSSSTARSSRTTSSRLRLSGRAHTGPVSSRGSSWADSFPSSRVRAQRSCVFCGRSSRPSRARARRNDAARLD